MKNVSRVLLGIGILSFIISFGSCISCAKVSSKLTEVNHADGTYTLSSGITADERLYARRMMISFAISLFSLVAALFIHVKIENNEKERLKATIEGKRSKK
jgi:hypothetical protein